MRGAPQKLPASPPRRSSHRIRWALVPLFALAASAVHAGAPAKQAAFPVALPAEAKSKSLCEQKPGRIHVATRWGTECIAYFVTDGEEYQKSAVIFFDGDVAVERFEDPKGLADYLASIKRVLQRWSEKLHVRYVYVSRVGVHGSSGNHGDRRKPGETMVMNTAVDLLKTRLGLERIVLAGQSGGSTIAASMLSLGRRDVACAVLGSGAFEIVDMRLAEFKRTGVKATRSEIAATTLDPSANVDSIVPDPARRILILGDQADTRTPFDQQLRYATKLKRAGHRVSVMKIDAQGELGHGATVFAIPTAGGCLKGTADEKLAEANGRLGRSIASQNVRDKATASGSLALLNSALRAANRSATFGD